MTRALLHLTFGISAFAFLANVTSAPLLAFEEPRQGLLADSAQFAQIGPKSDSTQGVRTFSEHFNTLQQHFLAVDGEHPPVFYFFCTVYYTARESGFTAERGFDTTPDGRNSLGSRRFPRDFVRATIMEGFGRLAKPVNGNEYLKYDGTWGYGTRPLGNRNNTLEDRRSAAVHRRQGMFGKGTQLRVLDPQIYNCFGTSDFSCADTGGGLFLHQVDLYWGEDDPLGPADIFRPVSCDVAVRWIVPVMVGK